MNIRTIFMIAATLLLAGSALATPRGAELDWKSDQQAARREARQTGKPILLLQTFGTLDEQWC